jgi:serine/threonine protein kinase
MISSSRQESASHFTQIGTALGTPQYMSPEQASGESHAVDARADIYGLGALLYSILTLQPPVDGGDITEVLLQVTAGRIAPPAEVARRQPPAHLPEGKIPPELSEIVMKALALDPANRYPTVRDLQAALHDWRPGGSRALRFGLEGLFRGRSPKATR